MKALHVIDSSRRGGGQIHVRSLLTALARRGHELHLAAPCDGDSFAGLDRRGVVLHEISMTRSPRPRNITALVDLLERTGSGILHLHGSLAAVWGRIAGMFSGDVSVVYTYHGVHYLRGRRFPRTQLFYAADRLLAGRADRVICVSEADRRLVVRSGLARPENVRVVKNGIDFREVIESGRGGKESRLDFPEADRIVVTVARLHRQKGHEHLLRAAVKVLEGFPRTTFLLVGDGPERVNLMGLANRLGIRKQVAFLGEREDVPRLLSMSDLFLLPSLWEGMPLSVLEAAFLRVPMVVSAVDGVREVLRNREHALLVPPGDEDAIAHAVGAVLSGSVDTESMKDAAARLVEREYSVEKMARETEALYRELRGGREAGADPSS
jgi:glycosyltransferase involved in cell wall biosynthesis